MAKGRQRQPDERTQVAEELPVTAPDANGRKPVGDCAKCGGPIFTFPEHLLDDVKVLCRVCAGIPEPRQEVFSDDTGILAVEETGTIRCLPPTA